jgi:TPR repeat protein
MKVLRGTHLFALFVVLTLSGLLTDASEPPKLSSKELAELQAKAEAGDAKAQLIIGNHYVAGQGVSKDETEAARWYRKAAEQGDHVAQTFLANMYAKGEGVAKDTEEAAKWYRKSAEDGEVMTQKFLGFIFEFGEGVPKDEMESAKWYHKAAEQGDAEAQDRLGNRYAEGKGVPKSDVEAYKWWLLAGAQGFKGSREKFTMSELYLTPDQRVEGQRLAREFQPKKNTSTKSPIGDKGITQTQPNSTGSGFFITDDGYLITNQHVADKGATVRVLTTAGAISAKIVKVDKLNDLALLKAEGKFTALPVASSRGVRLGSTAATVGFPNVGLQGFSPKLAKGEIASLAGAQDDARHFQISVPVQPGNSGGALVDERGNVIGVIVAKLSQKAALATTGTLVENVNYAVKSSYLLSFLVSVPEVAAKLKEPITADRKFEDVIKDVEQAAVLVLVY